MSSVVVHPPVVQGSNAQTGDGGTEGDLAMAVAVAASLTHVRTNLRALLPISFAACGQRRL